MSAAAMPAYEWKTLPWKRFERQKAEAPPEAASLTLTESYLKEIRDALVAGRR